MASGIGGGGLSCGPGDSRGAGAVAAAKPLTGAGGPSGGAAASPGAIAATAETPNFGSANRHESQGVVLRRAGGVERRDQGTDVAHGAEARRRFRRQEPDAAAVIGLSRRGAGPGEACGERGRRRAKGSGQQQAAPLSAPERAHAPLRRAERAKSRSPALMPLRGKGFSDRRPPTLCPYYAAASPSMSSAIPMSFILR